MKLRPILATTLLAVASSYILAASYEYDDKYLVAPHELANQSSDWHTTESVPLIILRSPAVQMAGVDPDDFLYENDLEGSVSNGTQLSSPSQNSGASGSSPSATGIQSNAVESIRTRTFTGQWPCDQRCPIDPDEIRNTEVNLVAPDGITLISAVRKIMPENWTILADDISYEQLSQRLVVVQTDTRYNALSALASEAKLSFTPVYNARRNGTLTPILVLTQEHAQ